MGVDNILLLIALHSSHRPSRMCLEFSSVHVRRQCPAIPARGLFGTRGYFREALCCGIPCQRPGPRHRRCWWDVSAVKTVVPTAGRCSGVCLPDAALRVRLSPAVRSVWARPPVWVTPALSQSQQTRSSLPRRPDTSPCGGHRWQRRGACGSMHGTGCQRRQQPSTDPATPSQLAARACLPRPPAPAVRGCRGPDVQPVVPTPESRPGRARKGSGTDSHTDIVRKVPPSIVPRSVKFLHNFELSHRGNRGSGVRSSHSLNSAHDVSKSRPHRRHDGRTWPRDWSLLSAAWSGMLPTDPPTACGPVISRFSNMQTRVYVGGGSGGVEAAFLAVHGPPTLKGRAPDNQEGWGRGREG